MNTSHEFPIYRKYSGIEVWFKINDNRHFVEVKKLGNQILVTEIHAVQFPEIQFIQDMINLHEARWELVSKEIVETLLAEKKQIKNPR